MLRLRRASLAAAVSLAGVTGCAGYPVPSYYRKTRDEPGHDLVKTEQFVVPVGRIVAVKGLTIAAPACSLTTQQDRIVVQVFNSLEELTEGIMNDPDSGRVAEYRGMRFEVEGKCASKVVRLLTTYGTPVWRLEAKDTGVGPAVRFRRIQ